MKVLFFLLVFIVVIFLVLKSGGSDAGTIQLYMDPKSIEKIHQKKLKNQVRYSNNVKEGDNIIYFAPGEKNPKKSHAKVKVKKNKKYRSVNELLKNNDWRTVVPEAHSISQARAKLNEKFAEERVAQRGLSLITF